MTLHDVLLFFSVSYEEFLVLNCVYIFVKIVCIYNISNMTIDFTLQNLV